ncbi:hypothetical protein [Thioalkalivibrio sp. ALJ7]|uniref:hypothetical protein n=1 Tax=Thioalkalivibrio sp. ALJ7 TaxID=1158756 RepID=UPI00036BB4F8|nr:hypothetical protein [Thioalkalivibrio sp. ALJ7]
MSATNSDEPIDIFWTGGWDSTFRVMELLHLTDRPIQPHYVIDPRRRSSGMEILTMKRISRALIEEGFAEAGRIQPLMTHQREAIPHDETIDDAFQEIMRSHRVGNQYRWLAMLVKAEGLDGIEIGIVQGDRIAAVLEDHLIESNIDGCPTMTVERDAGDVSVLFAHYSLPLARRGPLELRKQAKELGWKGPLAKTCFCHTPLSGMHPCGTCRPCVLMLERKGEAKRVGWRGKLRYWLIERPIRLLPRAVSWRIRQSQEARAAARSQKEA